MINNFVITLSANEYDYLLTEFRNLEAFAAHIEEPGIADTLNSMWLTLRNNAQRVPLNDIEEPPTTRDSIDTIGDIDASKAVDDDFLNSPF